MFPIVALDIETTGLDAKKDAVIEIGALRFNQNRIEDEWTTLIYPGRPIPQYITQLTGINNDMVHSAPIIEDVIPDLLQFIGKAPLLGHNVKFDLDFLNPYGVGDINEAVDTYDLASVLLPMASRYNLGALGYQLGIPLPARHRALEDARLTSAIFTQLFRKALELPIHILAEIVRLGEGIEWGGAWIFQQALRQRTREPIPARREEHDLYGPLFEQPYLPEDTPRLKSVEEPTPIDIDQAVSFVEYGGAYSHHFENFEYRPEQAEMLRNVALAFNHSSHLMVEAGTGVGKSIAYLVPAALWALQNNTRVVITTNTINLQDQLINKDIPALQEILSEELHATVLKGRNNYLCPRKLNALRRRRPETADEIRVLAKVLVWLQETATGDRQEINLRGFGEQEVWRGISAEDEGCTTETCVRRMGGMCSFHQVHEAAHRAHLLVVNHALLLADVATGNRILPEYDYLIIDEAHHLEEATTQALSFELTQRDVDYMLHELGGTSSGRLGRLLHLTRNILRLDDQAKLNQVVERATDLAFRFQHQVRQFFYTFNEFLFEQREGREISQYGHQERIIPATRSQPAWLDIETSWEAAQNTLALLLGLMEDIAHVITELTELGVEEIEDLYGNFTNLYRRLYELHQNLNTFVFTPEEDYVYWVEINPSGQTISLHAAPLFIGSLMERHLWHKKQSIILTSATLSTAGEFDYLRGRLSAHDVNELLLGSPFDYENAALVYIVDDIAEPSDRHGHQRAVERGLIDLCQATGGRTLALFTSYNQLKQTSRKITPLLAEHDIMVYEQGEGASPHSLLEDFRTTDRAVLLGTRAFWEGVDVPGEALSVLVIVKLPFDVPSDPMVAARSETFESPFSQYAIPEAILRFRQGFGRLIRTQYDRGVVAIFDKRVLTKKYGQVFLDSLPQCTFQHGPLSQLPVVTTQWLNI
ncbi:MAG: helicase C-terminal domain-containing protein [Chloroflexota bacterium]